MLTQLEINVLSTIPVYRMCLNIRPRWICHLISGPMHTLITSQSTGSNNPMFHGSQVGTEQHGLTAYKTPLNGFQKVTMFSTQGNIPQIPRLQASASVLRTTCYHSYI